LVYRLGTPPQILWLTCGNVTNRHLHQLLTATLPDKQLRQGEMIVEISNIPELQHNCAVFDRLQIRVPFIVDQ